jgi:hypothetical protein
MKSCHNHMKNIFLIVLTLCVCIVFSYKAIGQDNDFEMTVNITDASTFTTQDGSIQINIDKADNQYDYMLFDKEPWNGGKLLSEKKTIEHEAIFTALKAGKYFVCVRNSSEVSRCLNITIKSSK